MGGQRWVGRGTSDVGLGREGVFWQVRSTRALDRSALWVRVIRLSRLIVTCLDCHMRSLVERPMCVDRLERVVRCSFFWRFPVHPAAGVGDRFDLRRRLRLLALCCLAHLMMHEGNDTWGEGDWRGEEV